MAVLRIEGKEIMLPEDVVKGGEAAIRAVLAASGFPAIENVDITIEAIGCELRLADVYDRIRFESPDVEEGEDSEVPH